MGCCNGVLFTRRCFFTLVIYLIFVCSVIFYVANYDGGNIEQAIRHADHIVKEDKDGIPSNLFRLESPSEPPPPVVEKHDKTHGYKYDLNRMMEPSPEKVVLDQPVQFQVASLNHIIPRFEDIPPFWDDPHAIKLVTKQPASSSIILENKDRSIQNSDEWTIEQPYEFHTDEPGHKNRSIYVQNSENVISASKYVVISCAASPSDYNINYAFYLPLDVILWDKFGFRTIVILVGSEPTWLKRPALRYVLTRLKEVGAILIFVDAPLKNSIMVSQVSRLFIPVLLNWNENDDAYLLISDADIWPMQSKPYQMESSKKIMTLNWDCCGDKNFNHKDRMYRMLPMCNTGMSIKTWREVMHFPAGLELTTVDDIIGFVAHEFGSLALAPVTKGENDGWFMDQRLLSIRITQWVDAHGSDGLQLVSRNVGKDRIDRSRWRPVVHAGIVDAHLLESGQQEHNWRTLRVLLQAVLPPEDAAWADRYQSDFIRAVATQ